MRMIVGALPGDGGRAVLRLAEMTTPVEEARQTCLGVWRTQGGNAIKPLLVGFPHDLTLPRSFFAPAAMPIWLRAPTRSAPRCRSSEAVTGTTPDKIVATIGGCWGNGLEEYRIGFTLGDSEEVVHTAVCGRWCPMKATTRQWWMRSKALLRAANVGTIVHLEEQLPLEFCDDCGARTSQTAKAKCCTPICRGKRTPVRCTCIDPANPAVTHGCVGG